MGRMKFDRPKSARERPGSAAGVALPPEHKNGAGGPPKPPMQPLYNLNSADTMRGGGRQANAGSRPSSARPQSARGVPGSRMSALQALRGQAYTPGSDDEDEDDDAGAAIIDSPRNSPTKPRRVSLPNGADTGPANNENQTYSPNYNHAAGSLTTSSSASVLTPRGMAARKASGPLSLGSLEPPADPAAGGADGGVSDAMINARLKNARQKIQLREHTSDDPWNGETGGGGGGDGEEDVDDEYAYDEGTQPRSARQQQQQQGLPQGEEAYLTPRGPSPLTLAQVQEMQIRQLEEDQHAWLMRVAPRGQMVQCFIKRDKSGLDMLYPQYRCYLQTPDGDRFIMAARKRKKSNSNNYVISMNMKDLGRHSDNCIGKLRSNFIGTEFVLYDNGYNPKKLPKDAMNGKDKDGRGIRKELGVCINTQNVVGAPSPRKVRGLIPQVLDDQPKAYMPTTEEQTILARESSGSLGNDFIAMASKQPKYNNTTGKYSLNFSGRVKMASVKNVQLVYQGQEDVLLQFGKTGKNDFILDFQYPFTPMQAFAFGLTSLAYKLANEGG